MAMGDGGTKSRSVLRGTSFYTIFSQFGLASQIPPSQRYTSQETKFQGWRETFNMKDGSV
jgi:hypothetical protein